MQDGSLGIADRIERRIGRPSRVRSLSIRFTKDEERRLAKLAEAEGRTVREWGREALLANLKPQPNDTAIFTELMALRLLMNGVLRSLVLGEKMTPEQHQALVTEVRKTKHEVATNVLKQYQPARAEEE